tara:strand:+ start:545 stop:817 length:273 start_codon:yes stop_codon:yes gene_type:complete
MTENDNIKKVIYPDSPLGENNIITKIKNELEESPVFTYSSKLLREAVDNTNTKIEDKQLNIVDDYIAIFPLSFSLTLFIVILILIYTYFF